MPASSGGAPLSSRLQRCASGHHVRGLVSRLSRLGKCAVRRVNRRRSSLRSPPPQARQHLAECELVAVLPTPYDLTSGRAGYLTSPLCDQHLDPRLARPMPAGLPRSAQARPIQNCSVVAPTEMATPTPSTAIHPAAAPKEPLERLGDLDLGTLLAPGACPAIRAARPMLCVPEDHTFPPTPPLRPSVMVTCPFGPGNRQPRICMPG